MTFGHVSMIITATLLCTSSRIAFGRFPFALNIRKCNARLQQLNLPLLVTRELTTTKLVKKKETINDVMRPYWIPTITKKSDIPAPKDWDSDTDPFVASRYFAHENTTDAEIRFQLNLHSITTLQELKDNLRKSESDESKKGEKKSEEKKLKDVMGLYWLPIITKKSDLPTPEEWDADTDPFLAARYLFGESITDAEVQLILVVHSVTTLHELQDLLIKRKDVLDNIMRDVKTKKLQDLKDHVESEQSSHPNDSKEE